MPVAAWTSVILPTSHADTLCQPYIPGWPLTHSLCCHLCCCATVGGAVTCDVGVSVQLVVCDSPAGRLGLTVCYDLRFPEVYQTLTWAMGAKVLLVPSAFTKVTGVPLCSSPCLLREKY